MGYNIKTLHYQTYEPRFSDKWYQIWIDGQTFCRQFSANLILNDYASCISKFIFGSFNTNQHKFVHTNTKYKTHLLPILDSIVYNSSFPYQSMSDLWWTNWHWHWFFHRHQSTSATHTNSFIHQPTVLYSLSNWQNCSIKHNMKN